jgi:hypothetical protein
MRSERHERRRVTRAIKLALTLIAEQDPELGRLLDKSIKTGRYLRYSPASEPRPSRKSQRSKENASSAGKEPLQPD